MKKNGVIVYFLVLIIMLCALGGCVKNLTKVTVVYENDFESDSAAKKVTVYSPAGLDSSKKTFLFNGTKIFGRFNNNAMVVNLYGMPDHQVLEIEMDLYIHDKWTGDYLIPGGSGVPDVWAMTVDGGLYIITTFSNTIYTQSYPESYPATFKNPAQGSAFEKSLPGICALSTAANGTSRYRIIKLIQHSSPSAVIDCHDALQAFGNLCEKSWSVDNIKISCIRN